MLNWMLYRPDNDRLSRLIIKDTEYGSRYVAVSFVFMQAHCSEYSGTNIRHRVKHYVYHQQGQMLSRFSILSSSDGIAVVMKNS